MSRVKNPIYTDSHVVTLSVLIYVKGDVKGPDDRETLPRKGKFSMSSGEKRKGGKCRERKVFHMAGEERKKSGEKGSPSYLRF